MNTKTITVYDWFEIQDELCRLMGIEPEYFRNYHALIGGDYKDFWHVCLETIAPSNMNNGTIVTMYGYEVGNDYSGEHAWKIKVLDAWNEFYNKECPDDFGIYVEFSW